MCVWGGGEGGGGGAVVWNSLISKNLAHYSLSLKGGGGLELSNQ